MDPLEHAAAVAGVLRANARRLYRQAEEQRRLAGQLEDAITAALDTPTREDTIVRQPEAHQPRRAPAPA